MLLVTHIPSFFAYWLSLFYNVSFTSSFLIPRKANKHSPYFTNSSIYFHQLTALFNSRYQFYIWKDKRQNVNKSVTTIHCVDGDCTNNVIIKCFFILPHASIIWKQNDRKKVGRFTFRFDLPDFSFLKKIKKRFPNSKKQKAKKKTLKLLAVHDSIR